MSNFRLAMLVAALGSWTSGCGDDAETTPPPAPSADPAPAAGTPSRGSAPERDGPTEDLEVLDSRQYWGLRALGMIRSERELADGIAVEVDGPEGDRETFRVARGSLQNDAARGWAYRQAVHTLGGRLGSQDESVRRSAAQRLEVLTKTERGAPGPWLRWYREFGDYVRYDPELDRIEVDEERVAKGRPLDEDGLWLDVSLGSDRFKRGQSIPLQIRLVVDPGRTPEWVNRSMVPGRELDLELELQEDERSTEVELTVEEPRAEASRDDFVLVAGGDHIATTLDLAAVVPGGLAPGSYAVRVTYHNEDPGTDHGLPPAAGADGPAGAADAAGSSQAWTGELVGLTRRFRVVPW